MSRRKQHLAEEVARFVRQYARKHAAHSPNDRAYDQNLEAQIKRMKPSDPDAFMHGALDDTP